MAGIAMERKRCATLVDVLAVEWKGNPSNLDPDEWGDKIRKGV